MNKRIVWTLAVFAALVILAYTAFAANQNAIDNSQACQHASDNGQEHASDNSVLSSCVPAECPPNSVGTPPNCVCAFGTNPDGTCVPPG